MAVLVLILLTSTKSTKIKIIAILPTLIQVSNTKSSIPVTSDWYCSIPHGYRIWLAYKRKYNPVGLVIPYGYRWGSTNHLIPVWDCPSGNPKLVLEDC